MGWILDVVIVVMLIRLVRGALASRRDRRRLAGEQAWDADRRAGVVLAVLAEPRFSRFAAAQEALARGPSGWTDEALCAALDALLAELQGPELRAGRLDPGAAVDVDVLFYQTGLRDHHLQLRARRGLTA